MNVNILVFPCGSEIGLEIHRSLKYSVHVNLIGASSVDDHGKFVYENHIGGLPFIDHDDIFPALMRVIAQYRVDAIYPALDSVITRLKSREGELGCKVISSSAETADLCLSKSKTYDALKGTVRVPRVFRSTDEVKNYPVFIKPECGYGTRGTYKAECAEDLAGFFRRHDLQTHIMTEYLPGEEYTIDCFTDRHGRLLFAGPRRRNRIVNGISVNTSPVLAGAGEFLDFAEKLGKRIPFRGAWFFQLKRNAKKELTLLEMAPRIGGSSSLYRGIGVNFALLSIFDAFDIDVEVIANDYPLELDRALGNRFQTGLFYATVYVDFDDCLVIRGRVNAELVMFLYQAISQRKKVVLLTKHQGDLMGALKKYRLDSLFDEVIQLSREDEKYRYIHDLDAIVIDDSFMERKRIAAQLHIPVFSSDMIECLLD